VLDSRGEHASSRADGSPAADLHPNRAAGVFVAGRAVRRLRCRALNEPFDASHSMTGA